jgi:mRNA-degrading endonuclease RelE of RelBE toxin-antitoxin system
VPHVIEYETEAQGHLRRLTARQQSLVLDTVAKQLAHEPGVETKNRKPMRPNPLAPWELRIGDIRIYYDIVETTVVVLAIGTKERSKVRIGGELVDI